MSPAPCPGGCGAVWWHLQLASCGGEASAEEFSPFGCCLLPHIPHHSFATLTRGRVFIGIIPGLGALAAAPSASPIPRIPVSEHRAGLLLVALVRGKSLHIGCPVIPCAYIKSAFVPVLTFIPFSCRRTPGLVLPLANGKELLPHGHRMSDPLPKTSPRPDRGCSYTQPQQTPAVEWQD